MVTERIRPLRVQGQVVHQVWMPYHFGRGGLATGDVMNDLLGVVVDPNVQHPGEQGRHLRRAARAAPDRAGAAGLRRGLPSTGRHQRRDGER